MNTSIDEVAEDIYRISTFVPDAGISFNQILVDAAEPLLFHTGPRALFQLASAAVSRVMPVENLRWISFGHVEADECGAMNSWLAAAPNAEVAFGGLGCMVSVNDLADRPPRPLADDELLDLGGRQVRYIATPHVPHGWEAGVLYEQTTRTLLCGDLFTQFGDSPATSDQSPVEAAIVAEEAFHYSCGSPQTVRTLERLADLEPDALALMHGPTHRGDAGKWLRELAGYYANVGQSATAA